MSTRPWIVGDALWALIKPLLPPWPERSPGPRPVADRRCLQGILYLVSTHTRSARKTPAIQGRCPAHSLVQHVLDRAADPLSG
ncbi:MULTISPECIES: transposase [Streptomyces]|uniref:Transposase n=1 Tax=Streptomyces flaveolus TaxID=67297 RepID=A0ABV3ALY7_9ACTN